MKTDVKTRWSPTRTKMSGLPWVQTGGSACTRSKLPPPSLQDMGATEETLRLLRPVRVEHTFIDRSGPGTGANLVQAHPCNHQEASCSSIPKKASVRVEEGNMFILLLSDSIPSWNHRANQSLFPELWWGMGWPMKLHFANTNIEFHGTIFSSCLCHQ